MERYDPQADRGEVAARLGGRAGLPHPEPRPGRGARRAPLVPAGDAAVPVRDAAHGARPQLHDGRRPHALPPPAAAGRCCGRWAGTRSGCPPRTPRSSEGGHPREITERNIVVDPRADEAARLGDRLGPRGLGARARLLPLDAVAVPAVLRARPRLPQGGAGQLVPERPDGRRQRVRHRRPLRALRRAGRGAEPRAVVLQDHRVRRRAARVRAARGRLAGPSGRRRSSATGSAAREGAEILFRIDELDRTSPSSRRGRTRCSARRSSSSRPSTRWSSASTTTRSESTRSRRRPGAARSARPRRRRPASSPATTRQPRQRRAAADVRRRLRADGVRHGRDHGRARARRARPRVRGGVRLAHRRGRDRGRRAGQLGRVRRAAAEEGEKAIVDALREQGKARPPSPTACATGASRASATGAARSRSSTATTAASCRCLTTSCRCCCPRSRTTGRRACRRSPPTRSG